MTTRVLLLIPCAFIIKASAVLFPHASSRSYFAGEGNCSNDGFAFCMAREAVHEMDSSDDVSLEPGLRLIRLTPYDQRTVGRDVNSRGLADMIDSYLGERFLQWDLSTVYPGLFMNVVPDKTGPYLGFTLDESKPFEERTLYKGSKIVGRTILPFLLGLKIGLVGLVPLLIGALIIIFKKSIFFSKLGLLLGSTGLFSAFHRKQELVYQKDVGIEPEKFYPFHQNIVGYERHL